MPSCPQTRAAERGDHVARAREQDWIALADENNVATDGTCDIPSPYLQVVAIKKSQVRRCVSLVTVAQDIGVGRHETVGDSSHRQPGVPGAEAQPTPPDRRPNDPNPYSASSAGLFGAGNPAAHTLLTSTLDNGGLDDAGAAQLAELEHSNASR